jgi:hypothetical protein
MGRKEKGVTRKKEGVIGKVGNSMREWYIIIIEKQRLVWEIRRKSIKVKEKKIPTIRNKILKKERKEKGKKQSIKNTLGEEWKENKSLYFSLERSVDIICLSAFCAS